MTKLWTKAVYYANYLLTQIPTKNVGQVTPIENWFGKKPFVGHLRMFGCVSWAHIPDDYRNKLDAKSHAYIMKGYSKDSKAY